MNVVEDGVKMIFWHAAAAGAISALRLEGVRRTNLFAKPYNRPLRVQINIIDIPTSLPIISTLVHCPVPVMVCIRSAKSC